ncbi:MAG: hypothetical protein QM803_09845 [Rhodocyclaceae bacterium]
MNEHTNERNAQTTSNLARLLGYLREDPSNERLRSDAVDEAVRQQEFEVAMTIVEGSPELMQPQWQHRKSLIALSLGDHESAHRISTELLASGIDDPGVRYNAAYSALRLGLHETAAELARPLLIGSELSSRALEILLRAMHHQDEVDDALTLFRAYCEGGTLTAEALGVASLIAVDGASFVEAEQWARRAIAQSPAQLEAHTALGTLLLGAQNTLNARVHLERALALSPLDGRVLSAIGFCELSDGALDAARKRLTEATMGMPGHIGTWHGLGWCCIVQCDFVAAAHAFDTAISLDRNFAESHGGAAVVKVLAGQSDEARTLAGIALRLDATCLSAAYALALLNGEATDAAAVERMATRILKGRTATGGRNALADVIVRRIRSTS